ncbi:spore coat protein [Paenibacillus sp. 7541]|uniref:spore coat protein n=1 Tax=Paenibacillus sp. 7541 TaxID=2026236 RepID=UPI000BA5D0D7|nr:spore coat protein [Paenibacillus sp. 7541]PAK55705.1 spore coat protein [Paenibacillus sp. 7541]
MNPVTGNATGMNAMTDQAIAADLLNSAKAGIKNYATAIAETASPEVRNMLWDQLSKTVKLHEQIFNYMHTNGLYEPHDINKQIQMDIQNADIAIQLASTHMNPMS